MMKRLFLLFIVLQLAGCARQGRQDGCEVVVFDCPSHSTFSSLENMFSKADFLVPEIGENNDFMFSFPEQVSYVDGRLYILYGRNSKIAVFGKDGRPETCLSKKGRGPQEYLQISYFDIDGKGNFWILDGQRDMLVQYSPECSFLSAIDLDYQVNYVKCLDNGNFLLGLAPWDESEYGSKKVLLADSELNVISAMIDADDCTDPNYEFQAQGFITTGDGVIYHSPVDDYVYCLTPEGELESSYYMDFEGYSFPDEIRKDIETHYDELEKYRTLVNTVYVDDDKVVGSFLDKGVMQDFIINRRSNVLYLKDEPYGSLHLIGIHGKYAIRICNLT